MTNEAVLSVLEAKYLDIEDRCEECGNLIDPDQRHFCADFDDDAEDDSLEEWLDDLRSER